MLRWSQSPQRPAHRAGHLGDEPVPAARPARAVVGPVRPAAAADRHGLRPVRLPRPGRVHLRRLLRRAVRHRRHAVRRHAGARGRRAPVDDHAVDRARAARRDVHRAGLRRGARLAAVRRAGRIAAARRRRRWPGRPTTAPTTSGSPRGRSTRRRSRRRGRGWATRVLRRQVLAGGYRLSTPSPPIRSCARAARRSCTWPAPARSCPRCSPPRRSWPTRASPRTSSTSPRWTGSTPPGSARCGRASGRRPRRASRARCARSFPGRAPIVTVHDARLARDGLARLGDRRAVRAAGRRRLRPVRHGADLYELHDLLPGQHRQRGAGCAEPGLTSVADPAVSCGRGARSATHFGWECSVGDPGEWLAG